MRNVVKSHKVPINTRMRLASWVIFLSLLPLQSGFAALSCLWYTEAMSCQCGNSCTRSSKSHPEPAGRISTHQGQMGTLRQASAEALIRNITTRDYRCELVCSLQLPPGEAQTFCMQQQRASEVANLDQNHNVVSLMPRSQQLSHSPPSAGHAVPFYIVFSSLLI